MTEINLKSKVFVTAPPHVKGRETVSSIMWNVVIALMPAVFASIWFYRMHAVVLYLTCVITCLLTEALMCYLRKRKLSIGDGSAVITGLLLAMCLPPSLPVYAAGIGSVVSIALGKAIFGGLGFNIFNPALVGRAFLLASYPVLMTNWVAPHFSGVLASATPYAVDAVTSATPLALAKYSGEVTSYLSLFLGNVSGSLGETSKIALIIGAVYLRYKKIIDWRLPVSYIGTVVILGSIYYFFNPETVFTPLFHVISGGLILGAFFMATDMVTTPVTQRGKVIFGLGAGFIVFIIRIFGGLPEGVMFSILFMNALTPLINRYTRPKLFGVK